MSRWNGIAATWPPRGDLFLPVPRVMTPAAVMIAAVERLTSSTIEPMDWHRQWRLPLRQARFSCPTCESGTRSWNDDYSDSTQSRKTWPFRVKQSSIRQIDVPCCGTFILDLFLSRGLEGGWWGCCCLIDRGDSRGSALELLGSPTHTHARVNLFLLRRIKILSVMQCGMNRGLP